jgi:hypothetical protein
MVEVIELSVRTGKPVLVLGRRQVSGIYANERVMWTNAAGATVIVAGDAPPATGPNPPTELGIVTAGITFTPLPKGAQAFRGDTPTW